MDTTKNSSCESLSQIKQSLAESLNASGCFDGEADCVRTADLAKLVDVLKSRLVEGRVNLPIDIQEKVVGHAREALRDLALNQPKVNASTGAVVDLLTLIGVLGAAKEAGFLAEMIPQLESGELIAEALQSIVRIGQRRSLRTANFFLSKLQLEQPSIRASVMIARERVLEGSSMGSSRIAEAFYQSSRPCEVVSEIHSPNLEELISRVHGINPEQANGLLFSMSKYRLSLG